MEGGVKDEFPRMPSRRCKGCGERKKIVHFAKTASCCRACHAERNAQAKTKNPAPAAALGGWSSCLVRGKNGQRRTAE